MSISRRNFVIASAALAALGPRTVRAQSTSNRPEYLIVCIADGGWDTLYALDPKPGVADVDSPEGPMEYQRTFADDLYIQCNDESRPSVTRFFEDWGSQTALINGMSTGSIVHEPCRIRLLTGTTQASNPDWATRFGYLKSTGEPLGSIDFSGLGYPGSLAASTGRVGVRSQLKALLDPNSTYKAPTWADYQLPLFQPTEDQEFAIREVLEQRAAAYKALRGGSPENAHKVEDMLLSLDRRTRLQQDAGAITGELDLGTTPSFRSQTQLAVGLLRQGLCRAVTIKHELDWDTHASNAKQPGNFEDFFRTLSTLLEDLQANGILDKTLVVVVSEMGRTPRMNISGGKDHWTHTSQMIIGAGVQGGRTYGATNDGVESKKMDLATGEVTGDGLDDNAPGDLLQYTHFAAGILAHLDIDPAEYYPGITPFTGFSNLA